MAQTKAKWNMIVWKKALVRQPHHHELRHMVPNCLIKLRIAKGTLINLRKDGDPHCTMNGINQRKSRAKSVEVIGIFTLYGSKLPQKRAWAYYDTSFCYTVGRKRTVKGYNLSSDTCAQGIHFFVDREDAIKYSL